MPLSFTPPDGIMSTRLVADSVMWTAPSCRRRSARRPQGSSRGKKRGASSTARAGRSAGVAGAAAGRVGAAGGGAVQIGVFAGDGAGGAAQVEGHGAQAGPVANALAHRCTAGKGIEGDIGIGYQPGADFRARAI